MNGFEQISNRTIPHVIPDIPHETLTWIYNFLERFSTETNHNMFNVTLPLQLSKDISLLIEHLYDSLIEANYVSSYLTNEYAHTLEFLSATTFNQHGTSPYPESRALKRILFRNQYAYDLTRHLQFILRESSHWPVHHPPPPPSPPPPQPPVLPPDRPSRSFG